MDTCLSDLFSYYWMRDTETYDPSIESLET